MNQHENNMASVGHVSRPSWPDLFSFNGNRQGPIPHTVSEEHNVSPLNGKAKIHNMWLHSEKIDIAEVL